MQPTVEMRLSVGDAIGESEIGPIPDVFRRVKFRRVGREKFWMQSWSFVKERSDGMMAVDRSPIPQQHNRSPQVPEEILQKELDISMFEAARAELHVKSGVTPTWRDADGPKGRDSVLLEPMVEVRCLASWCPGAPYIWDEQKSTFIHEYEMGAKFCGFFLFGAIPAVPSAEWLVRPFGVHGVRVFDSSTRCSATVARHGSGDSSHGNVSRSLWLYALRSRDRLNIPLQWDLSADTLRASLSVLSRGGVDAPGWVWDGVP